MEWQNKILTFFKRNSNRIHRQTSERNGCAYMKSCTFLNVICKVLCCSGVLILHNFIQFYTIYIRIVHNWDFVQNIEALIKRCTQQGREACACARGAVATVATAEATASVTEDLSSQLGLDNIRQSLIRQARGSHPKTLKTLGSTCETQVRQMWHRTAKNIFAAYSLLGLRNRHIGR